MRMDWSLDRTIPPHCPLGLLPEEFCKERRNMLGMGNIKRGGGDSFPHLYLMLCFLMTQGEEGKKKKLDKICFL